MLEIVAQVGPAEPRHQWQRLLPAVARWFEREQPDLVLFHQERSATTACIQFAARTLGSRVLWTGDGLLRHTMQVDERGLDADASCRRWTSEDFAVVAPDDALLHASLTHALANGQPLALPRATASVPQLRRRLTDAAHDALSGRFQTAMTDLIGWRAAFPDDRPDQLATPMLDLKPPFLAVLLQDANDPRVLHDASQAPDARDLIQRAVVAADALGPETQVVAVLPDCISRSQLAAGSLAGEHGHRVRIASAGNAAVIAATSAATITINHPAATVALLSGTPVVHLGRALYELPGVTTSTTLEQLPDAIASLQQHDCPELRRPFLTWLLQHGHVWCSATAPNHNGMLGLVQAVERRLLSDAEHNSRPLPYRPGPTWPLAMQ